MKKPESKKPTLRPSSRTCAASELTTVTGGMYYSLVYLYHLSHGHDLELEDLVDGYGD